MSYGHWQYCFCDNCCFLAARRKRQIIRHNLAESATLNEGAYKPDQSGIDPALLREVTGPTQVFKIASGEMTPEDYAAADATVFQRGPPDGAPTTRFNKDKRYKARWVEPMVQIHELEPSPMSTCYWFPVFHDSIDFLCDSCRRAQTMDEIEMNQCRPSTCINCSANTQDHYKKSAPTLGARKSVLMLAARLKVAFANCGLEHMDINEGFQKWLVFAAASVVANANLRYGEELMKSLSHMWGVRVPPHQAREIFKNGRGKQFSVYRERIFDPVSKEYVLAFRLTKDCGNVAYEQVAVPEAKDRNKIFAHTRASAEKSGDIIEFWLGVLDVANMTKGLVNIFDINTDPADFLNGLEKALRGFGSVSRTTSTINDKRRGSFDCTLQPAKAQEVLRILDGICDYEHMRDFNCMTDYEAAFVIEEFHKKKGITGDDVNMGDDAEAQPGLGSTTHPGEADAEEPQDDFADAARESERSGKQQLLDALGNLFAVSESVNVCIFCGSTKHDHADCTGPKKADINKVLKGIRASLEDASSRSDVDMEAEGGERKEGTDEAGQQATEEEPAEARTGEYHWYDTILYMSEVGDMDEAGKFCMVEISPKKDPEPGMSSTMSFVTQSFVEAEMFGRFQTSWRHMLMPTSASPCTGESRPLPTDSSKSCRARDVSSTTTRSTMGSSTISSTDSGKETNSSRMRKT